MQATEEWDSKALKEKPTNLHFCIWWNSKSEGEIKIFSDKQKLGDFMITWQEMRTYLERREMIWSATYLFQGKKPKRRNIGR